MRFYDMLQLDPAVIKNNISEAESKKEKRRWVASLLVRDVLIVSFAVIFISAMTVIFGEENSSMAVVTFCILLSIRFIDFGYNVRHSLFSLAVLFAILLFSPQAIQMVSPSIGFLINFFSILVMTVLACENPEMGNGGLYLFGYIFLTGNFAKTDVFYDRALLTLTGYIICGAILIIKHRNKNRDVSLGHVVGGFDIRDPKSQWQLQLALGISLLFFLNRLLGLDRFIWVGFACSSLLSSYPLNVKERLPQRAAGVVLGSIAFGLVTIFLPEKYFFVLGPVSGLCLGLCATYKYKTLFNCFGALSLAMTIYGIEGSVLLRILNNMIGIFFGALFFHFFQKVFIPLLPETDKEKQSGD